MWEKGLQYVGDRLGIADGDVAGEGMGLRVDSLVVAGSGCECGWLSDGSSTEGG